MVNYSSVVGPLTLLPARHKWVFNVSRIVFFLVLTSFFLTIVAEGYAEEVGCFAGFDIASYSFYCENFPTVAIAGQLFLNLWWLPLLYLTQAVPFLIYHFESSGAVTTLYGTLLFTGYVGASLLIVILFCLYGFYLISKFQQKAKG